MEESKMPYTVRQEEDPLAKVVLMKTQREELREKIIETAESMCDVTNELRDIKASLRDYVKKYDANVDDNTAKYIADLSVAAKRCSGEIRTFGRNLRQHVSDLRALNGKGGTIDE